jgi:norsolorinic acid ketoreductase
LKALPAGKNSKVLLVKIDSDSEEDPRNAMETVLGNSIDHIDVAIANAGTCKWDPVETLSVDTLRFHHNINTIGPLLLFQAFWPLLQKAAEPKFIIISSSLGSLVEGPAYNLPSAAYGASKASINYMLKLLHRDHPNLIAMPVCPG